MQLITRHLIAHAHNNAWANHRLHAAVAQLTHDDWAATRTSFFPSIQATLNHIYTVDRYYVDAMQRSLRGEGPHPSPRSYFDPEVPHPRFDDLHRVQVAIDAELIALCKTIADDESRLEFVVQVPRTKQVDHEPLHRLLAHLYEHQTHHRGQAHAMLSGTPVAPPQLDEFFCADDAPRRVTDFRELGFSESAIWQQE